MRYSTWLAGLFVIGATMPIFGIEIGGELFVDLDASTFDPATDIWSNSGSYTDFTKVGTADVVEVGSYPAVVFDGGTAFVGAEIAPEAIVFDEQRTIEAWVYNPNIAGEETVVSWGRRGGPEASNMSFNYGSNGAFGAVGHWGAPDLGWNDAGGAPDPFKWHHLVYTYDLDGVTKVYANGELANEENTLELIGGLNTWDDTAIAVGAQWLPEANFDNLEYEVGDPAFLEPGLRGTLGIGRLRIHDEALSAEQITSNYNLERATFVSPTVDPPEPPVASPLRASPIHRYSFNNPESFDATDATLTDSIGGAHGVVLGDGAEFTGTALRLPGGDPAEAAYGDLPNGLISGLQDVTIESWTTTEGDQNWARIFDFGSNSPGGEDGELLGPGDDNGGDGQGLDYFLLSASRGGNSNDHRVELRNEDPAGGGVTTLDATIDKGALPNESHFAVVYDADGFQSRDFLGNVTGEEAPVIRLYFNGEFVDEQETDIALSDISDVNNWLGRSNWTVDANFQGTFDEFRIYDYALNQDEILGSHEAGPETLDILEVMSGDCNNDSIVSTDDLACIVAAEGAEGLNTLLDQLNVIPGDLDADGTVAFADFLSLSGNFGSSDVGYPGGDIDGDGTTGFSDFLVLSGNFGQTSEVAASTSIPEPSAWGLGVISLLLLPLRRRRSCRS